MKEGKGNKIVVFLTVCFWRYKDAYNSSRSYRWDDETT